MMKNILIIAVLAYLAFAQPPNPAIKNCGPTDGINCTMEQKAVCGIGLFRKPNTKTFVKKLTFQNHCIACMNKSQFSVDGDCSQYPDNANFCTPQDKTVTDCNGILSIKCCGWYNLNVKINAENRCLACSYPHTLFTTTGACS